MKIRKSLLTVLLSALLLLQPLSIAGFAASADREQAVFTRTDATEAAVVLDESNDLDYEATAKSIYDSLVSSAKYGDRDVPYSAVRVDYFAGAGGVGEYVPLNEKYLGYKTFGIGRYWIRVSCSDTEEFKGASFECEINIVNTDGKMLAEFTRTGETSVALQYDKQDSDRIDYAATAECVYNTLVASASCGDEAIPYENARVEYFAGAGGVGKYVPLNEKYLGYKPFGIGNYWIRISWMDTDKIKGTSFECQVKVEDVRATNNIVFVPNAVITYNKDVNVMKQDILDNVIDWENSNLPAKETVSVDDFEFEYYGVNLLPSGVVGTSWSYSPMEGGRGHGASFGVDFPRMGASITPQDFRARYIGDANYLKTGYTQTKLTVKKAKASMDLLSSAKIYAGEALPENLVTVTPENDEFDIYMIFAGLTKDMDPIIYMNLPEKFENKEVLAALNPIVKAIKGKTIEQILNDGITVGELKNMLTSSGILDALKSINSDGEALASFLETVNAKTSFADSTRIAFGTPSRVGAYGVTVFAVNPNYEPCADVTTLLVMQPYNRLAWNTELKGAVPASEAANTDFGATLYYGNQPLDGSHIHYLYTGYVNGWKLYSSTKAPTKPGKYVVTACIIGGDSTAPITRSFTISK